ncbi:hypothetical protein [Flexivirga sp. B27]
MHVPTGLELMSDDERALLDAGERVLACESATQLAGHSGIGDEARPGPGVGFDADPMAGGVTVDQRWVDAAVGGVNAAGARGSLADRFSAALDVAAAKVVITDRRLLVLGDEGTLRTTPVRIRFEVPRAGVVELTRAPRALQRGRVRISFRDGSWAMAMTGLVKKAAADRLVTAYRQS